MIEASDLAAVGAGVDDLRIGGIGSDVAAFAAADAVPVGSIDSAIRAGAGDADRGIVLLRAVDVIRKTVVCDYVIELRGGLIVLS